jgi:IS5 family transposase
LHVGVDRETGLVTHHVVTAASVHDSQVLADLVDGRESEVVTDKAYDSRASRRMLAARGVLASVMKRTRPGHALSAWRRARNRSIGPVRNSVEGVFASLKRYLGCRRAAYRGLERVMLQMTFGGYWRGT